MKLSLMLVDDHAAVRAGYCRLLESEPGWRVVAQAGDADSAYAQLQRAEAEGALPDLLLLDLSLDRGRSGLDLLERCRQRFGALRIIVCSMHEQPALIDRCLQSGAQGYVSKSSAPQTLFTAIEQVSRGGQFVDPAVAEQRSAREQTIEAIAELTSRELEVLSQIVRGVGVAEVAATLNLSPKTVANHLTAARQKLNVDNDFQLMRRLNLLELPAL